MQYSTISKSDLHAGKRKVAERRAVPQSGRKPLRLHGSIARTIGIQIVSGEIKPGDLLEGEIISAEQLSVSRTAYREARPKVGTRANPRALWHLLDPDVLDWAFEREPDLVLLDSLFELRNVVESSAAAFAAARRTQEHLNGMRRALEGMAKHTLAHEAGRQADLDFHTILLLATGNPFIISLANGVRAAVRATTIYKQRHQPLRRDPWPDHLRVFEAIAAGQPVLAQEAMSALVRLARIDTPTKKNASTGKKSARRDRSS